MLKKLSEHLLNTVDDTNMKAVQCKFQNGTVFSNDKRTNVSLI